MVLIPKAGFSLVQQKPVH